MVGIFRLLVVGLSLYLGTSIGVNAASFDCSKASTVSEKTICDNLELSKLDLFMDASFSARKKVEQNKTVLIDQQRLWIEERDKCLSDIDCIKSHYRKQVYESWNAACNDKFSQSNVILDNAYWDYGTAYSGGDHSQSLGSVASTLDLYRGLNDLNYLGFTDSDGHYDLFDRDPKQEILKVIDQKLISKNNLLIDDDDKYDLGVIYDIALSMHNGDFDWWITESARHDVYFQQIAELSKEHESLDWILSVMSASHLPWNIDWHLTFKFDPKFEVSRRNVLTHAIEKFETTQNWQWLVVASMFTIQSDEEVYMLKAYFDDLVISASGCMHSSKEHLIINILAYELTRLVGIEFFLDHRFLMSNVLTGYSIERLYKKQVSEFFTQKGKYEDVGYYIQNLKNLANVTDNPYYLRKIGVGLSYLSKDIPTLASNINFISDKYHEVSVKNEKITRTDLIDAKLMRMLNVLKLEDLVLLETKIDIDDHNRKILLNAALNRSFVLGEYNKSREILKKLTNYLSKEKRRIIESNSKLEVTDEVFLALTILDIEDKTTWIINDETSPDNMISREIFYKSGTDLNDAFINTTFLNRDLNAYLMHPTQWKASSSMCCINVVQRIKRYWDRSSFLGYKFDSEPRFEFDMSNGQSVVRLVGTEQVKIFAPESGLSRKLSEAILNWDSSDGTRWYWRSSMHDRIAESLSKIVRLQKRNKTGKIDDKYIGQIAYEKLKHRYSDTTFSEETKYWFKCEYNCR